MNRFRPALNALIGLMLIVQGVAVASSGFAPVNAADAASEVAATVLPCHGDQNAGSESQSCCDADCPNMLSCALGHLAVAPVSGPDFVAVQHPVRAAPSLAPVARPPPALLRPPIPLHV